MTIQEMEVTVEQYMDGKRFRHTLGVMYTAAAMAMAHGANINEAMIGGLLHDCAKCVPRDIMLKKCDDYGVVLSEFETSNLALIHGKLGVAIAKKHYEITSEDVLNSISFHTTGRKNMSLLEKIVYVADCIEPYRSRANLEKLREYAFSDIDRAVFECSRMSLEHLESRNIPIDPLTKETYEFYKPKEEI